MAGSSTARCPMSPPPALLLLLLLGCTNDYDGLLPPAAAASTGSSSTASSGGAGGGAASSASTGGMGGADGGSGGAASSTVTGPGGSGGIGGATGGTGGTPPVNAIACTDGVVCTGQEICCISEQGPSNFEATCTLAAGCADVQAECDGSDDCPEGEICCGHYQSPSGDYTDIECQPTCEGNNELEMCFGSPATCLDGNVCAQSDNLGADWGFCSD